MNDILRRSESGVDPATPWGYARTSDLRQLEIESFPIRVRDQVNGYPFVVHFHRERDSMRARPPVRLTDLYTVPCQISAAEEPVEAYALAFNLRIPQTAPRIEQRYEPMHIRMLLK
jgi:hypothetical protein